MNIFGSEPNQGPPMLNQRAGVLGFQPSCGFQMWVWPELFQREKQEVTHGASWASFPLLAYSELSAMSTSILFLGSSFQLLDLSAKHESVVPITVQKWPVSKAEIGIRDEDKGFGTQRHI